MAVVWPGVDEVAGVSVGGVSIAGDATASIARGWASVSEITGRCSRYPVMSFNTVAWEHFFWARLIQAESIVFGKKLGLSITAMTPAQNTVSSRFSFRIFFLSAWLRILLVVFFGGRKSSTF